MGEAEMAGKKEEKLLKPVLKLAFFFFLCFLLCFVFVLLPEMTFHKGKM